MTPALEEFCNDASDYDLAKVLLKHLNGRPLAAAGPVFNAFVRTIEASGTRNYVAKKALARLKSSVGRAHILRVAVDLEQERGASV